MYIRHNTNCVSFISITRCDFSFTLKLRIHNAIAAIDCQSLFLSADQHTVNFNVLNPFQDKLLSQRICVSFFSLIPEQQQPWITNKRNCEFRLKYRDVYKEFKETTDKQHRELLELQLPSLKFVILYLFSFLFVAFLFLSHPPSYSFFFFSSSEKFFSCFHSQSYSSPCSPFSYPVPSYPLPPPPPTTTYFQHFFLFPPPPKKSSLLQHLIIFFVQ